MGKSVSQVNRGSFVSSKSLLRFTIRIGFKQIYKPDIKQDQKERLKGFVSMMDFKEILQSAEGGRISHIEPKLLSTLPAPEGRLMVNLVFEKFIHNISVTVPHAIDKKENDCQVVFRYKIRSNQKNIDYEYGFSGCKMTKSTIHLRA